MTFEEIQNRVNYHRPTEEAVGRHERVRGVIFEALEKISEAVPPCREQSLAITKLEEAMFWANAGIARNHDKLSTPEE